MYCPYFSQHYLFNNYNSPTTHSAYKKTAFISYPLDVIHHETYSPIISIVGCIINVDDDKTTTPIIQPTTWVTEHFLNGVRR